MPDNFFKKQLFSLGRVLNYVQTLKNAKDFDESLALILKTFDNQTLFFNGLSSYDLSTFCLSTFGLSTFGLSTYGLKVSRKLTI